MFCSVIVLRKEKRPKSPAVEHSSSAFKVCYRTSSPAVCQHEVNPKSKQSLCKLFTCSSCLWFCYVHGFSKIFIYIFIGVCFPSTISYFYTFQIPAPVGSLLWGHCRWQDKRLLYALAGQFCVHEKNSVALVRERTIPTERPPPVGEVSASFCG